MQFSLFGLMQSVSVESTHYFIKLFGIQDVLVVKQIYSTQRTKKAEKVVKSYTYNLRHDCSYREEWKGGCERFQRRCIKYFLSSIPLRLKL